jgi:23S rRNA pseudouridine2605 synthase
MAAFMNAPKRADMPVREGERIAKYLSRAGKASRRDAERLIAEGRVSVDGKTLDTPAVLVMGSEDIRIDGQRVEAPKAARLFRYNKPVGTLVTRADPEGRPTVFDQMPPGLPRVIAIGRLDLASEGLLLLTTDGSLARHLELPATGWTRRYRVRVHGRLNERGFDQLAKGAEIDGIRYGPIVVQVEKSTGTNHWLIVSLKEGKNREVRKAMSYIGLDVNRLIRIAYGPFLLGGLERGDVQEVTPRQMRDFLGKDWAKDQGKAGRG